MRGTESFLKRLEERLSRVSVWIDERGGGGPPGRDLHARAEDVRRELARVRHAVGPVAHEDLARVRATLDDMRRDYEVPQPHTGLSHAELEAFRRHLQKTAHLVPVLANLDSPGWDAANEEYERSWAEVEQAFAGEGHAASP